MCCTWRLDGTAFEVGELHALRRYDGEIAIAKEEQIARVIQNRRNIRGNEEFVFAQADYGGRSIAGGDDLVGLIGGDALRWRRRH